MVCHNCEEMFRDWKNGKRKGLPFGTCMVWRKPKEHLTDCYFCLVNTKVIGKKNRLNISYPRIPSAINLLYILTNFHLQYLMVLCLLKIKKINLKKSTWKWSRKEQIQSLRTHLPKATKAVSPAV